MAICRGMALMVGLVLVRAMDSSMTSQFKKCDVPLRHYTELDCKPVFGNGTSGCPERYDCSSMLAKADDKCYVKSKAYNIGEKLESRECLIDCSCHKIDTERSWFRCDSIIESCNIDWSKPCVYQYALGDCCHNKIICDPEEKAALATCTYENRTYSEGEKIYDGDSCKTCICGKGFDGTLKSLQCLEQSCDIEIHNGNVIKQRCAPVYYGRSNCCPMYWKCPESEDKIIQTNESKKSDDPNMKCKYGEQLMNIGDEVEPSKEFCVKCKCIIPPMVSCNKDRKHCY